jgi:hypothetical protein
MQAIRPHQPPKIASLEKLTKMVYSHPLNRLQLLYMTVEGK